MCSAFNFVPKLGSSCKQSCTPSICMGLLLNYSLAELRERRLYILKYANISVSVLFYHCTTMPQCSLYTFIACSVIVPGTLPWTKILLASKSQLCTLSLIQCMHVNNYVQGALPWTQILQASKPQLCTLSLILCMHLNNYAQGALPWTQILQASKS